MVVVCGSCHMTGRAVNEIGHTPLGAMGSGRRHPGRRCITARQPTMSRCDVLWLSWPMMRHPWSRRSDGIVPRSRPAATLTVGVGASASRYGVVDIGRLTCRVRSVS
jgi:hypothetical protein